jgi:hypothetical protein
MFKFAQYKYGSGAPVAVESSAVEVALVGMLHVTTKQEDPGLFLSMEAWTINLLLHDHLDDLCFKIFCQ